MTTHPLLEERRFSDYDEQAAWRGLFALLTARARGQRDLMLSPDVPLAWWLDPTIACRDAVLPLGFRVNGEGTNVPLAATAARQLANRVGMRWHVLRDAIERGSQTLCPWLSDVWQSGPGRDAVMVRTVQGVARAFRSRRYGCLDDLPVMRQLERPCRTHGLRPVRVLATPTLTRIELGTDSAAVRLSASRYRPGLVITNSELGLASLAVTPGIVRQNAAVTRLSGSASVRRRHTSRNAATVTATIATVLPSLIARAESAIQAWEATRYRPLGAIQALRLGEHVRTLCGRRIGATIVRAWQALPPEERTPTACFRLVAAAYRDCDPLQRTRTDALLTTVIALTGPIDPASGDTSQGGGSKPESTTETQTTRSRVPTRTPTTVGPSHVGHV